MKKVIPLIFSLIILITGFIPGLFFIINFSSTTLSPKLVINGIFNTTFTQQFDDYFSDQFSFKNELVTTYNNLMHTLFTQSGNPDVIVGNDRFLFYQETLNDYLKISSLSNYDIARLDEVLRLQKVYLMQWGIESHWVIVPNKATIYPQYMPISLTPLGVRSNLDKILETSLAINLIDVKRPLLQARDNQSELLYHYQDSHWNNIGAAIGYTSITNALQQPNLDLLSQTPTSLNNWSGDLARMLYPSSSNLENQFYYVLPNQFIFSRAIRTFEDIEIESINSTQEKSLFMFRDSFANALIPFLSESFYQVNYSRAFPYDYRKVLATNPDFVILQIAERNIDWYLQSTPILMSQPQPLTTTYSSSLKLDYQVTQSIASTMSFINARFTQQEIANPITAVKIIVANVEYDAFPIYQDDDFTDRTLELGFSLYTSQPIDVDQMVVLVKIANQWLKLE